MRFYILSDLHLRAEVEAYKTSDRIKRLCSKIRQAADIGENILFIILGDIVDKGKELSFTTARDSLSLIQEELKDYAVKFEFEYYDFMSDYRSPWVFNKILQKP